MIARCHLVLFAVLATGCAAAVPEDTAEDQARLSVVDHDTAPPAPSVTIAPRAPNFRDRDHDLRDPLGPEGRCAVIYTTLLDPARNETIVVPIVRCE